MFLEQPSLFSSNQTPAEAPFQLDSKQAIYHLFSTFSWNYPFSTRDCVISYYRCLRNWPKFHAGQSRLFSAGSKSAQKGKAFVLKRKTKGYLLLEPQAWNGNFLSLSFIYQIHRKACLRTIIPSVSDWDTTQIDKKVTNRLRSTQFARNLILVGNITFYMFHSLLLFTFFFDIHPYCDRVVYFGKNHFF